jgi:hypothetical protein
MSYPPQQPEPEPGPYGGGQYPPGPMPGGPFGGNQYPPGGYPAPGQLPGGYQPGGYQPGGPQAGGFQAVRPGRPGILVSAVLLGILAVAALGIALALGHAASACSSDIGQIAQAFDQQAAGDCSTASTARTVLEIAAPVLAIGCVAAIVGYRRR